MRIALWFIAALMLCSALIVIIYLLKPRSLNLPSGLNVADLTGVVSLSLNAALFIITIISLVIAVAAYKASEESGRQQQKTLDESRSALQRTADTLEASAKHFKESAEAGQGLYSLSQAQRKEREEAVRRALIDELHFNKRSLVENEQALKTELAALQEQKSLIQPLQILHTGAWELLKVYIPPQLTADSTSLTHVATVYRLTQRINEVLTSREEYRIHNQAMSNFQTRMQSYDQELQGLDGELTGILPSVLKLLEGGD